MVVQRETSLSGGFETLLCRSASEEQSAGYSDCGPRDRSRGYGASAGFVESRGVSLWQRYRGQHTVFVQAAGIRDRVAVGEPEGASHAGRRAIFCEFRGADEWREARKHYCSEILQRGVGLPGETEPAAWRIGDISGAGGRRVRFCDFGSIHAAAGAFGGRRS